jgi:phosphate/phosphite/phosphonate ABC transporter binding protein
MKSLRLLAVTASLLAAAARAADPLTEAMAPLDPNAPLTLGIGQPNGPTRAEDAKALLEPYLTQAMKRPVKVAVLADYEALALALSGGKVDLAWITPVAFVDAQRRKPDVQAIAKSLRRGKLFYRACLFVKAGSPIQSTGDLQGKAVAWVSKGSASGYVFPRALLAAEGKDPDRLFRSQTLEGDHPAVCDAVRSGKADAGATFCDERPKGESPVADGCAERPPTSDFRVVALSAPIPNDVVAARSGFDERLVESTLAVFAQMSQSEAGRRLLREVFRADGWGLAVAGDFDAVVETVKGGAAGKGAGKGPVQGTPGRAQPKKAEKPAK